MPFADLPHARIHYALSGHSTNPALILSNSLGTNFSMWDAQAPSFEKNFHLLRYDMRGHGQSSVTPPPYSVPELASDVLALADSLAIDRFHFCGLSIGGMIGMSLALQSPQRLGKLILCSTAPKIGTPESWNTRIAAVRAARDAGNRSNNCGQVVHASISKQFPGCCRRDAPRRRVHESRRLHRRLLRGSRLRCTRASLRHSCSCSGALRNSRSRHPARRWSLPGQSDSWRSLCRIERFSYFQHRRLFASHQRSSCFSHGIESAALGRFTWTNANDTNKA